MLLYFIIYKPFQVLSQFTPEGGKRTLKDYFPVPSDVYPVGRLDYDSEGLLLLTNDKQLNYRLLDPRFAHEREYWVQVEGTIDEAGARKLEPGVIITVDGKPYRTKPCKAIVFDRPPAVPERNPPIRYRKNVPDSWLKLLLTEGKNRQVRKMTAQAGFPTLRLIRYRIERLTIEGLQPGDMRALSRSEIYSSLFS
ncbi:pseudouridine synthase [Pseudoflavitalea sp. X16]|uniref:pseudouridine synthase n=1 Tax=Paraflavitalea devenefica TaxID=2716334 RepID=UPI001422B787|nr:pseudouridine synthase [Paraflavitalea devenefica]NII24779.1 pseudouridine synthase [Paraflavitalea devenefica]